MNKYAVINNQKVTALIKSNQRLSNYLECPEGAEDVRDLKLETVTDEMGQETQQVVIDEDLRAARIAADAAEAKARATQKALADKIAKQRARREAGLAALDLIGAINNDKGTALGSQQFLSSSEFQAITQLLQSGYLESARAAIQAADVSLVFTLQEKQEVLDFISDRLSAI